jgi:hypothetical protein
MRFPGKWLKWTTWRTIVYALAALWSGGLARAASVRVQPIQDCSSGKRERNAGGTAAGGSERIVAARRPDSPPLNPIPPRSGRIAGFREMTPTAPATGKSNRRCYSLRSGQALPPREAQRQEDTRGRLGWRQDALLKKFYR